MCSISTSPRRATRWPWAIWPACIDTGARLDHRDAGWRVIRRRPARELVLTRVAVDDEGGDLVLSFLVGHGELSRRMRFGGPEAHGAHAFPVAQRVRDAPHLVIGAGEPGGDDDEM